MYGYVVVDKSALRIREYDYYRATYCGLCHAMGKCTGCVSRATLSYDMAFFVLVREMIDGTGVKLEKKRCIRHPINGIDAVYLNDQLEYSAYVSGILTAGKIKDNISDERGAKRALAQLLGLVFSKMERAATKNLPTPAALVEEKLAELARLERERTASIDMPADVFGRIMSELLAYGFEGARALVAGEVGYRLGRWIYIVDALDDYDSDRKSGSYNPFVLLYNGEDFTEDNIISVSKMLEAELSLAFSALELLDDDTDKNRSEIIKNILCLGMPASVARICDKHIIKIRRI